MECIIGCLIFGVGIVGSVLKNKVFWLQEYAPAVQEKFLSLHPEYKVSNKKESIVKLIIKKTIGCVIFIVLLSFMVYIAGARDFAKGFCYCYIIWFVVNLFDVVVLDIGILAHWKKCRLPGTEDMDEEYMSNHCKSIVDGIVGMAIGVLVALIVGCLIALVI
jgi:hypothetical protein